MLDPLGWTEDRVDLLKKMHKEGASGTEIANAPGGGATRNSVIGKIHRLKLPRGRKRPAADFSARVKAGMARSENKVGRPSKQGARQTGFLRDTRLGAMSAPSLPQPQPEPFIDPDDGVDVTGLIGLMQLNEHTCKWPIGDPLTPDFGFCGKPSLETSPYCAAHDRRAYHHIETGRR